MPQLTGKALKALKTLHLVTVSFWLGGGMVLLLLTCAKYAGWVNGELVHGVDLASHLADQWVVVIMGAFPCLGTALIYGLFTGWGFFRHRWLMVKWAALIGCIFFGMWLGGREAEMLALSRSFGTLSLEAPEYRVVMGQYMAGVIVQIAVILGVFLISVFRPWQKKGKKGHGG